MARPPKGNEPLGVVALQASLLSQAAAAGVPVSAEALEKAAGTLAKFTAHDVRVLEVLKDAPLALASMARLADENPDAFLRHWATFLEFSRPKLARVEHTGNAQGGQIFIAVESREAGPPEKLRARVVSEQ